MSIDCSNATNSNAEDIVSSEVQERPFRLSTTSQEGIKIEASGNNGVLDPSNNSRVSSGKISLSNQQRPESKHAVLKKYQSKHLQSEELSFEAADSSRNKNDSKLESEVSSSLPSTSSSNQKARQNEFQAICRFYERNNFCKFGQSCRFLHEGRYQLSSEESCLVPSTSYESYSYDSFDTNRRFRNVEENEYFSVHRRTYRATPVCRYFQYYGFCDYGDRCKFEHAFIPQTDRSSQHRQTPLKKKNTKEKEDQQSSYSVKTAEDVCTDNSELQNVTESHVSDGDIDSASPLGDIKLGTEKSRPKKISGRSQKDKPHSFSPSQLGGIKSGTENPQPKKTTGRSQKEKHQLQNNIVKKPEKPKRAVCRFFKQNGNCKYEDRCMYLHSLTANSDLQIADVDSQELDDAFFSGINLSSALENSKLETETSQTKKITRTKSETDASQTKKTTRTKLETRKKAECRFFKQYGNCKYGDRCRYLHKMRTSNSVNPEENVIESIPFVDLTGLPDDHSNTNIREENNEIQSRACKNIPVEILEVPSKPPLRKPLAAIQIHLLDELSQEDLKVLRQTEITQLKKRFPKCEVLQEDDSGSEYVVEFLPSDPDWPFEVKLLNLKVLFSPDYPLKPCFVEVVDAEDCFPETLVRYLDRSIQSWIKKRQDETEAANKVEIIFKPFLRWLDRNLEDLFINGLRMVKKERDAEAAGIEFVPYEKLQTAGNLGILEEAEVPETDMFDNQINVAQDSAPTDATLSSTETKGNTDGVSSPLKRGTEVVLRNLALGDSAATLVCRKIALTLQCGRCKSRNEIDTPANRSNRIFCTKCHHVQTLTYRPQLLHEFGCILGYLDLAGCQVVDMPIANCHFEINCLQCSTNMPLNGLHFGQRNDNWCHQCNSKMTIFVESVKFHQLQPSTNQVGKGSYLMKLEPKEKKVKDPAIQEGKPLPSDGTCKHFKKSFRWLRFSCCGKAYPCDVCHNEKETDHDMKFATRMICGFCAKEQPYSSEKPCVLCKSSMTKKSSTHWEGGKGCRDKTKMSRDDQHKYSGTSKTLSRKVQEKTKK